MPETQNGILGRVSDGAVRLRVLGRAVALQCPAVRAFVKEGLSAGAKEVRVELGACEHCDSTFMGTLLRIRKAACEAGAVGPLLVAPSPQAEAIVRKMGLARLFTIEPTAPPVADDWQPLVAEESGTGSWDFKENVVVAHRELASNSDTCAEIYDTIADAAEAELNQTPRSSDDEC